MTSLVLLTAVDEVLVWEVTGVLLTAVDEVHGVTGVVGGCSLEVLVVVETAPVVLTVVNGGEVLDVPVVAGTVLVRP